jgi:hypothetical protein
MSIVRVVLCRFSLFAWPTSLIAAPAGFRPCSAAPDWKWKRNKLWPGSTGSCRFTQTRSCVNCIIESKQLIKKLFGCSSWSRLDLLATIESSLYVHECMIETWWTTWWSAYHCPPHHIYCPQANAMENVEPWDENLAVVSSCKIFRNLAIVHEAELWPHVSSTQIAQSCH